MKMVNNLFILFVLFIGLQSVDGQQVGICLNALTASLENEVPICDVAKSYVKCVLMETGLYKTMTTDSLISTFKNGLESTLAKYGIHCTVDVKAIVNDLMKEDMMGVTRTTKKPTELWTVDGQQIDVCVDALTASLKNGVQACDAVKPYLKCVLRETKEYKKMTTDNEITRFKNGFESVFAKKGIYCYVDVKAIVNELMKEDGTAVTGYQSASTVDECINALTRETFGKLTCSNFTPYLKCLIRVLNVKKLNANDYSDLQQTIRHELSRVGLDCNIDFASLVEQVQREEHTGSGSDFVAGSFQNVTLIMFAFLSMFLHQY